MKLYFAAAILSVLSVSAQEAPSAATPAPQGQAAVTPTKPLPPSRAPVTRKVWPAPMDSVEEAPPEAFSIDLATGESTIVVTNPVVVANVFANWVAATRHELLVNSISIQGAMFASPLVKLRKGHPDKDVRVFVSGAQMLKDGYINDLDEADIPIYFQSAIVQQLGMPVMPEPRGTFIVRDGESVMFLVGFHAREVEVTADRGVQVIIINSVPVAKAFRNIFGATVAKAPNTRLHAGAAENAPDLITGKNLRFDDEYNPQNTKAAATLPPDVR